ncbi:MAG: hypothetical protein IPO08_22870 [Xanthomonadales bacterium]|nr:hypothetical protein [Xanthomonadales bacterium]
MIVVTLIDCPHCHTMFQTGLRPGTAPLVCPGCSSPIATTPPADPRRERVREFYNGLTDDEREAAFLTMVDYLTEADALHYSTERQEVFWDAHGGKLGALS